MSPFPLKILVVDEEPLLLFALERAFRGRSFSISTANSKNLALTEIAQCNFDVFLLDFDVDDCHCLDLIKSVDELCPFVPIIIMTTLEGGSSRLSSAMKSLRKHGTWYLLEKPFGLERLIHLIDVIFREHESAQHFQETLTENFDQEKRYQYRRPHVQTINFSFKRIADGESRRFSAKGIVTDLSDCGSGILSNVQIPQNQVIHFEDNFVKQNGVVAWSAMIEKETCRFGVQFC